MAAGHTIDALGQFELHPALGAIGKSVGFSQSTLMMAIAAILTLGLLAGVSGRIAF